MESGDIIENLGTDIYLRTLLAGYGDYELGLDGVLRRDDPSDYGYVSSSPYKEFEVQNSEGLRKEVLAYMIRHYNAYHDFIYNLQEPENHAII